MCVTLTEEGAFTNFTWQRLGDFSGGKGGKSIASLLISSDPSISRSAGYVRTRKSKGLSSRAALQANLAAGMSNSTFLHVRIDILSHDWKISDYWASYRNPRSYFSIQRSLHLPLTNSVVLRSIL